MSGSDPALPYPMFWDPKCPTGKEMRNAYHSSITVGGEAFLVMCVTYDSSWSHPSIRYGVYNFKEPTNRSHPIYNQTNYHLSNVGKMHLRVRMYDTSVYVQYFNMHTDMYQAGRPVFAPRHHPYRLYIQSIWCMSTTYQRNTLNDQCFEKFPYAYDVYKAGRFVYAARHHPHRLPLGRHRGCGAHGTSNNRLRQGGDWHHWHRGERQPRGAHGDPRWTFSKVSSLLNFLCDFRSSEVYRALVEWKSFCSCFRQICIWIITKFEN